MSKLKEFHTPVFWAEGPPGELNREGWVIEVSGLCANPKIFTWKELIALPKSIADARLTSVTRFSVRGRWGGVKVADLLDAVQADTTTKYVRFWSYRMIYDTSSLLMWPSVREPFSPMSLTVRTWKRITEALSADFVLTDGATSQRRVLLRSN
jgi:DMSO/TMAO reductase YedYZ molybdopterin-dependent catalytic subunit